MNILLTGATGFLGSHLLPKLIERGYRVVILKRSFSDTSRIEGIMPKVKAYDIDKTTLEEIFQKNKIDTIIHLATDYGKKNNNDSTRMIKTNIEFPVQLLDLNVKYNIRYFINTHTSTNSEYTLYSATKNAFTEIAKFFIANHQICFINMVIEYMYGEEDDDNIKFIPFVIKNILSNKEIRATSGEQKRDFIYVGDVVRAYLKVIDNLEHLKEKYIEFNIGTGQAISLKLCIDKIEKLIGQKADIKWGDMSYRKNEVFYSQADISRAKELLGWEPQVSLEEGLNSTIQWYKNYTRYRKI